MDAPSLRSEFRSRRTRLSILALAFALQAGDGMAATTVLIAKQSAWRYLDDGSNQGTAWTQLSFNEELWSFGRAELGYGDEGEGRPETTVVRFGDDPNNRHITTYFRRYFYVENAASNTTLTVRLLRDDGGVVYLNGIEVFRSGMPEGPIDFLTLAEEPGASGSDETTFFSKSVDPQVLFNGINVVAVEVHQRHPASGDISFDLELVASAGSGEPSATVVRGPYLQSGTTTNLIVRWRTDEPTDSRVRFGLAPTALQWETGNGDPSTEHIVTLTNLAPNTKYFYSVGTSGRTLAGGADHYFVTAPATPKPTRIWAIGDSGTASWPFGTVTTWRDVRDSYATYAGNRETDVWLMLGDNAYNWGTDAEYQIAVFDSYAQMLRKNVLWSTIGNHETYAPQIGEPVSYFDNFSFPTDGRAGGEPSGTENYYSFDYSDVHFVCIDSELADNSPGSAMLNWLEADLAANTKRWTIAFFHSPPYNFGTHNSDNPEDTSGHLVQMRENVVPILERHGVDMVLSGHSHTYERSFLLHGHYGYSPTLTPGMIKDAGSGRENGSGAYRKDSAAGEGAVYIVCGSSGWVTGDTFLPQYLHPAMFIKLKEAGSMVIDVDGNRLDAKFLRETGAIDDYFTIIKGDSTHDPIRIAMFQVSNGMVMAQWNAVQGRRYRVEKTISLEQPDWQNASGEIIGAGPTASWAGPATPNTDESYYRVRLVN